MPPRASSIIQGYFGAGLTISNRSTLQLKAGAPLRPGIQAFPVILRTADMGFPLPNEVRGSMEAAFGAKFSEVRIHVGPDAASIGAWAFTRGADIHFAAGRYNPYTPDGRFLLAHELSHVLQQREGRVTNPLGQGIAVVQDHALEAEANRMARQAVSSIGRVMQPAMQQPAQPAVPAVAQHGTTRLIPEAGTRHPHHSGHVGLLIRHVSVSSPLQRIEAIVPGSAHPVGRVELRTSPADGAQIANLNVTPEYRRRGIGSALVSAAVQRARAQGAGRVWLEARPGKVSISTEALLSLYQQLGFRTAGQSSHGNPVMEHQFTGIKVPFSFSNSRSGPAQRCMASRPLIIQRMEQGQPEEQERPVVIYGGNNNNDDNDDNNNNNNPGQEKNPWPENLRLVQGGKYPNLDFDNLEALALTGELSNYFSSEAACKQFGDQYEIWLTKQSLHSHLPQKKFPDNQRRFYYVAHGSARNQQFDDKDANALAQELIQKLQLDQPFNDEIVVRLVGCYSANIIEAVTGAIKAKIKKIGGGGKLTIKGTKGTYFRTENLGSLVLSNEGDQAARSLFNESDQKVKATFETFKQKCTELALALLTEINGSLKNKDDNDLVLFLIEAQKQNAPTKVKTLVKEVGRNFGVCVKFLKRNVGAQKDKQTSLVQTCSKICLQFQKLLIETARELMEIRHRLLETLFEFKGKDVVAKGTGERHKRTTLQ